MAGRTSTPPQLTAEMSAEQRHELILDWWGGNFEDPAERTPYESAEGGYQWIWGGPYDADEEIATAFPYLSDEERAIVVELIQENGQYEWAPALSRRELDDDDSGLVLDETELDGGSEADRRELVSFRLNELEKSLSDLRAEMRPGMGHNQPPEPIEASPLTAADMAACEASIETTRSAIAQAAPDKEAVAAAEGTFRRIWNKLKAWAAAAAAVAGGVTTLADAYEKFAPSVIAVADALRTWLEALPPTF